MPSLFCERAIENANRYGNALLKFISPNDVGETGGHQCGFYLPKSAYQMFTPYPPIKGRNSKHQVKIQWQEDKTTASVVTWYGTKTRSEYRLTRFGKDFPFLNADTVGDLLVLIPICDTEFLAYVLDLEEDIDEIQSALGIEAFESWGIYHDGAPQFETLSDCLDRQFRNIAQSCATFPSGLVFSENARKVLNSCIRDFLLQSADEILMASMEAEYQLFRMVERQVCQNEIVRVKKDVDDFLRTASSIMNRRKARAGRSLENHVEFILRRANIPFEMRPKIDGNPDIVIPSREAYYDESYPLQRLLVVGVKTTCKDRWRQVLNEGKRVPNKYVITIQKGISNNQLREMKMARLTLVVPRQLHRDYPRNPEISLLDLEQFVESVQSRLS
jgi:EcoRII C terminal/Restriction endonuclease EcoRII, N-terminal